MKKLRDATLAEVIRAMVKREYEYGKNRRQPGQRGSFYSMFYERLDHQGKPPALVVVEGRSEMFVEMPEGIQWGLWHIEPADLPRIMVINSAGWNGHPRDFSLPERARAIWEGKMDVTRTKDRILDMLREAESTFASNKTPVLIAKSEAGPWTVLEGNHTMIAASHIYAEQKTLPLEEVFVGLLPQEAAYRFLREGALNRVHTRQGKTSEDIVAVRFPEFVREAVRVASR